MAPAHAARARGLVCVEACVTETVDGSDKILGRVMAAFSKVGGYIHGRFYI